MGERRRAQVTVVLLAAATILVGLEAVGPAFLGWPASGLVAGAAGLCPRRRRRALVAGLAVGVLVVLVLAEDLATAVGLLGRFLAPALAGLALGRGQDGHVVIDDGPARRRYDGWQGIAAVVAAAITAATSLTDHSLSSALGLGLLGGLSTLAGMQVAFALLLPPGSDRPLAGRHELWAVRCVLALTTAAILVVSDLDVILFLALAAFGWASTRMSRREAVIHLTAFAVVTYLWAFTPFGLLTAPDGNPTTAPTPGLVVGYLVACGYVVVPLATAMERLKTAIDREAALADTNRRLLTSETSTMIVTTDARRRITGFNRGAEAIMGWSAEEVAGHSPDLFHPPESVAAVAARLGCAAELGAVSSAQMAAGTAEVWEYQAKDGGRGFVRLAIHPLRDPETGSIIGSFAIGDDVTHQQRADEALAAALDYQQSSVRRLREADEVKQTLVSNVSHELRTPVTSIRGYAELIDDGALGPVTVEQHDAVERIVRNADRLTFLVENLLVLARPTDADPDAPSARVDLREVVEAATSAQQRTREATGLRFEVRTGTDALPVVGDAASLRRIVLNLVSNAIKFTPDGGTVSVRAEAEGPQVRLTVADTGTGIAPGDREQLFTRFFRAGTATTAAVQGSGLGLSSVHALVTAHGGEVQVSSDLGRGTTVVVTLPLASGTRADAPRSADQLVQP